MSKITFDKGADASCKNIRSPFYDEKYALYNLYYAIDEALEYQQTLLDNYNYDAYDAITITVNGTAIPFILGGPQVAALYEFIDTMCEENLYEKPWDAVKAYK